VWLPAKADKIVVQELSSRDVLLLDLLLDCFDILVFEQREWKLNPATLVGCRAAR
jgi:hypothetical protein